jgi:hypothetical protein
MAEWLCSPVLSDVTVQCTDGAVPAHKLVLASGSTLLANAITNSQDAVALGQAAGGPPIIFNGAVLKASGASVHIVKTLLTYLYTGTLAVERETVYQLLALVDTFGITELLQPLMQFAVQKALTLHNAGPLLQSATRWHLGEIRKQVLRFMALNAVELCQQSFHLTLSHGNFESVLKSPYFTCPRSVALAAVADYIKSNCSEVSPLQPVATLLPICVRMEFEEMRVWLRRHPGLLSEAETLELYESWHMSQRQEAAARKTQGQPMPQTVKVPQPPADTPRVKKWSTPWDEFSEDEVDLPEMKDIKGMISTASALWKDSGVSQPRPKRMQPNPTRQQPNKRDAESDAAQDARGALLTPPPFGPNGTMSSILWKNWEVAS